MRAVNLTKELEAVGPIDPDAITRREARARADVFYRANGRRNAPDHYVTQTGKLKHSADVYACGLQFRPGDASGVEVCQWRTAGCTAACVLETSFRGKSDGVRDGRDLRTLFLQADPQAFVTLVAHELRALVKKYGRVAFRPNIASDLRWEFIAPALFTIAGVEGYDYTKANPLKHRGSLPNYRLCYSVSESPISEAIGAAYVNAGGTAAVVVATPDHPACTHAATCTHPSHVIPPTWKGAPTVNGDLTDDRTNDPAGCYVILWSKADGRRDRSGFVKSLELVEVAS